LSYRRSEAKAAARAQFRGVAAALAKPVPDGHLDRAGILERTPSARAA